MQTGFLDYRGYTGKVPTVEQEWGWQSARRLLSVMVEPLKHRAF